MELFDSEQLFPLFSSLEGASDASFFYTGIGYLVQLANGSGFDTCTIKSLEVPQLYQLGVTWSDFCELEFTPIIEAKNI